MECVIASNPQHSRKEGAHPSTDPIRSYNGKLRKCFDPTAIPPGGIPIPRGSSTILPSPQIPYDPTVMECGTASITQFFQRMVPVLPQIPHDPALVPRRSHPNPPQIPHDPTVMECVTASIPQLFLREGAHPPTDPIRSYNGNLRKCFDPTAIPPRRLPIPRGSPPILYRSHTILP